MKNTLLKTLLFLLLISGVAGTAQIARSQVILDTRWSPQAKIPNYEIDTETAPMLIADRNKTVHAFNTQPFNLFDFNSQEGIYYRRWTAEAGWTQPIDIIVNRGGGQIALQGVFLDEEDTVHMIFQQDFTSLFYTWAPLLEAGNAGAWSRPVLIAEQVQPVIGSLPFPAAITGDGRNNLVVVYGGRDEGNGTYAITSANNGVSWESGTQLLYFDSFENVPGDVAVIFDNDGYFHAVWNYFRPDGSGGAGYYANYDVEQSLWSTPEEIDTPGIRTPSIVAYDGDIILVYYHQNVNANWWRLSPDQGETWSDPRRLSTVHVGTNGAVSFARDSLDNLYAFFGQRINEQNHGIWYVVWNGAGWVNLEAVVRGPQVRDMIGEDGFDPRSPSAVISNGNTALVAWGTDGFAGVNGAWYSYARLSAPELPVQPLASREETALPGGAANVEGTNEAPVAALPDDPAEEPQSVPSLPNQQSAILWGILPVLVLLIGIFGVRLLARPKSK